MVTTFPYQSGRRLCRVEWRNTGAGSGCSVISSSSGSEFSVVDDRIGESAWSTVLSSLSELAVVDSSSLVSHSDYSNEILCLGTRGMGGVSGSGRCLKGLSRLKCTTLTFLQFLLILNLVQNITDAFYNFKWSLPRTVKLAARATRYYWIVQPYLIMYTLRAFGSSLIIIQLLAFVGTLHVWLDVAVCLR